MDTTEELFRSDEENKINEEKMRAEELTKRRMTLERRNDHLKEIKTRASDE